MINIIKEIDMNNKLNNTDELPVLEPLMPGEDTPSEPISQYRDHQNAEDKIADIMAQAHIKRGKAELRESMMQTNTIVYLLILLVLVDIIGFVHSKYGVSSVISCNTRNYVILGH